MIAYYIDLFNLLYAVHSVNKIAMTRPALAIARFPPVDFGVGQRTTKRNRLASGEQGHCCHQITGFSLTGLSTVIGSRMRQTIARLEEV